MDAQRMSDAVKGRLEARIATCQAAGNEVQAKKWQAELKALTLPAYANGLVELGFDPAKLDGLAIYATQKMRRLVAGLVGAGKADPYTSTVIENARRGGESGVIANKLILASLSGAVKIDKSLVEGVTRRAGTEATASTQASSTRAALAALGLGRASEKGVFQIDLNHPAIQAIA